MRKKVPIQWKLFGFFVGFIMVLLLILWLLQTVFLGSIYKSIKADNICSVAEKIESHLDDSDFNRDLQNYSKNEDLQIFLFSQDGTCIQLSWQDQNDLPQISAKDIQSLMKLNSQTSGKSSFLDFPQKEMVQADSEHTKFSFDPKEFSDRLHVFPEDALLYAENVEDTQGNTYLLLIAAIIAPIHATTKTLQIELLYITAIMLVLAFIFALMFSRKISKPIESINESAKNLAAGNYDTRFSENGYREISELAETLNYTANELAKVESLRRELIANVSHDLRTPLTMIIGYSEVMRDIPGENKPENVQVIIDEANRLTRLVNDMLDLSKLQAGEIYLQPEIFNFTDSIQEIIERYKKMQNMEGYIFRLEASEKVNVLADKGKIYQVIYNLINNAIHYCGQDKTVTIRQVLKERKVRLEIQDTGKGIASEDIPYIWDRYYKGRQSHDRFETGTGLGLSIVKKIILLHHGSCGVESELGHGSTFWFEIPIEP
jgi:signal transduction histidine kinase